MAIPNKILKKTLPAGQATPLWDVSDICNRSQSLLIQNQDNNSGFWLGGPDVAPFNGIFVDSWDSYRCDVSRQYLYGYPDDASDITICIMQEFVDF